MGGGSQHVQRASAEVRVMERHRVAHRRAILRFQHQGWRGVRVGLDRGLLAGRDGLHRARPVLKVAHCGGASGWVVRQAGAGERREGRQAVGRAGGVGQGGHCPGSHHGADHLPRLPDLRNRFGLRRGLLDIAAVAPLERGDADHRAPRLREGERGPRRVALGTSCADQGCARLAERLLQAHHRHRGVHTFRPRDRCLQDRVWQQPHLEASRRPHRGHLHVLVHQRVRQDLGRIEVGG
mmetsp:Transcript_77519/g.224952  ORF Transcript_77519/g.224952 Transcript_77519/m.224952 type:complete len:238 (-) Transcript_77519:1554-2267(-)